MKKHLKSLLKVGISVALIALLLRQVDGAAIVAVLADANPWGVLATMVLFALTIPLRAVRWKVLLDGLDIRVPLRLLTYWYYVGAFFNTILPTGFGGDVVKTLALAQYSHQTSSAAGTVVFDRFLGILVLLAMGVLALPFSRAEIGPVTPIVLISLFVACVLGFWFLRQERWLRWGYHRLLAFLPARGRQRAADTVARAYPFYLAVQSYRPATLAWALAASFAFNLLWVAVNVVAGWALGIQATLVDYLVFVPLVSLALLLPSFGGIGVRELSYVGLFTQVGTPAATAFALSLLVYAATVVTGLFGALLYLLRALREWQQRPAPEGVHPTPP